MKVIPLWTFVALLVSFTLCSAFAASDPEARVKSYQNKLFLTEAPRTEDFKKMAAKDIKIAIDLREKCVNI